MLLARTNSYTAPTYYIWLFTAGMEEMGLGPDVKYEGKYNILTGTNYIY